MAHGCCSIALLLSLRMDVALHRFRILVASHCCFVVVVVVVVVVASHGACLLLCIVVNS